MIPNDTIAVKAVDVDRKLDIVIMNKDGHVRMAFSVPVAWVGLDKETAMRLGESLLRHAVELT